MKSDSSLTKLLMRLLCLCQRLFVPQSITYKSPKTPTANLHHSFEINYEPNRKDKPAENAQRLRPDCLMHEPTRPEHDQDSVSETQSDAVQVNRRHNRFSEKVDPLFNDYFSRVPSDQFFYALTITLHDFKYFKSGARVTNRQIAKDECERVAKRFHHLLCQKYVRKNDYNNSSTAHLVPHAIFVIEHSAKMSSHLHAIISLHKDIEQKIVDEIAQLKDLMPERIESVDLQKSYDVYTWKNYIIKDIKHTDDVLPTIRPFNY